MAPILGKVSQLEDGRVEGKHASLPIALGGGESADLNQLAGRQEHGVEQSGIGNAATLWVEPSGRAGTLR